MKYNSFHHFFSVSLTTTVGSIRGRCRWTVSRIGRRSSGDTVWIRTSYASITWVVRSLVWQCYEAICQVEWWGRDSPLTTTSNQVDCGLGVEQGSHRMVSEMAEYIAEIFLACAAADEICDLWQCSPPPPSTLLSSPFGQCSANDSPSCHVSIHADILSCLFLYTFVHLFFQSWSSGIDRLLSS